MCQQNIFINLFYTSCKMIMHAITHGRPSRKPLNVTTALQPDPPIRRSLRRTKSARRARHRASQPPKSRLRTVDARRTFGSKTREHYRPATCLIRRVAIGHFVTSTLTAMTWTVHCSSVQTPAVAPKCIGNNRHSTAPQEGAQAPRRHCTEIASAEVSGRPPHRPANRGPRTRPSTTLIP